MIRKPNDDLFKDTTMTFGEHLEELRVCLWRAVVGIALGFIIGLLAANQVVQTIKGPLERALSEYYRTATIEKYDVEAAKLVAEGSSATLPYSRQEVLDFVEKEGKLFDIYYVNPTELTGVLRKTADTKPDADEATDQLATDASSVPELRPIFLWHRLSDDQRIRLIGLNAQEAFMIWIKAGLIVGLVLASPWVFWQLWSFVAAGLYPHEKKYVHVFLPFSLLLFLLGASTAFLFVFDPVLNFLLSFNRSMGVDPDPRISEWLGFVLLMPLAFGVSFQLPLVMLFLERIGIFNVAAYLEKWKIAILVIFIASMILSPGGDPYSMLLMAIPLTFLYFGGVLLCKYLPKGRSPFDE